MKVEFSPNFDDMQRRCVHLFNENVCQMERKDQLDAGTGGGTDVLMLTELVSDGEIFTVLRGIFRGQRVCLKFVSDFDDSIDALHAEAENYRTCWTGLQQQNIIPHYLGFFRQAEGSEDKVACLMLEDCGSELEFQLEGPELTREDKLKIMTLLAAVDLAGYQIPSNQFDESNIVVRDGEYRLVSIRKLVKHECEFTGNLWENGSTPTLDQFKCGLLLDRGRNMEFWVPEEFEVVRIGRYDYRALLYPDQATCDVLLEGQPASSYEEWDSRKVLLKWLRHVKRRMAKGPVNIERLKKRMPELPTEVERQDLMRSDAE